MPQGAIPYPFGKCRICNDKATGVHYGAATCEGCKGFFKRSIPKAEKYRCFFGGSCTLTPKNRNRCKFCRFKRCVDIGMALEAVKMGRIPKVEKEKALEIERHKMDVDNDDDQDVLMIVEDPLPNLGQNKSSPHSSGFGEMSGEDNPEITDQDLGNEKVKSDPNPELRQIPEACPREVGPAPDPGYVLKPPSVSSQPVVPKPKSAKKVRCPERRPDVMMERPPGVQSPGMRPSEIYNATVIRELFTHALENICQDGVKGKLMEKFLHLSVNHPQEGSGEHGLTSSVQAVPSSARGVSSSDRGVSSSARAVPSSARGVSAFQPPTSRNLNSVNGNTPAQIAPLQLTRSKSKDTFGFDPKFPYQSSVPQRNVGVYSQQSMDSSQGWFHSNGGDIQYQRKGHHVPPQSQMGVPPLHKVKTNNPGPMIQKSDIPEVDSSIAGWAEDDWSRSLFEDKPQAPMTISQNTHSLNVQSVGASFHPNRVMADQRYKLESESYGSTADYAYNGQSSVPAQRVGKKDSVFQGQQAQFAADAPNQTVASCPVKSERKSNNCHVRDEGFFSDFAVSLPMEVPPPNDKSPTLPPNSEEFLTLDDIKREMVPDAKLTEEELVDILEKTYLEVEARNVKGTRDLKEQIKNGTHMESVIPVTNPKPSKTEVLDTWNLLIAAVVPSSERVSKICNAIPGFSRLESDDQNILIQTAFFDVWLICHCAYFYEGEIHMLFDNGMKYCLYWMRQFLPDDLIQKFFDFTIVFNSCNLTNSEVAVLLAVRATIPERPGLKEVEAIKKLNDRYLNLFVQKVIRGHPKDGGNILKKLFSILPNLAEINEHQNRVIGNFKIDEIPDNM